MRNFEKVYFAELKLQKMFLLLSYVNWISVQIYSALHHHAHKPRCVLQETAGYFLCAVLVDLRCRDLISG